MKRRLVTPGEILALHYQGIHSLRVPPDAIVTPGAKDLILSLSFRLIYGDEEPAPPAGCCIPRAPAADSADLVRRIVAELAPQLDEKLREKVIRAVAERMADQ